MANTEEQIKKMYQSQLNSQKEQLKQDYLQADSDLTAQKANAQKATDANLNRTMVEAQKAAVSNAELRNASGLSSGAAAQARLSEENQLQSDLTALRVQQQEVDAEAERQRSLLAQEYASAIRKAQAENDLAKAQALYEEASRRESAILSDQQASVKQEQQAYQNKLAEAKWIAEETGDFSLYGELMGLSASQIAKLNGQEAPEYDQSEGAKKFINRMMDADTFSKWGYVEVDGKGITDYKDYVAALLNRWAENGIPEKALDTGGDKKLTNAEIAYLVQYYGLG